MLTARCCFAELKVSSDSHDSRCAQLRGDSTAPLPVHGSDEAGTAPLPVHGGDAAGGTLARGTPVLDKGVCDGVEGASGGGLGGSGGVSTETRRLGVWGTTFTRMSLISLVQGRSNSAMSVNGYL